MAEILTTATATAIANAITAAMRRTNGLPSHVYVRLPRRVTRATLDRAAAEAQAWVREYDEQERTAIVACR